MPSHQGHSTVVGAPVRFDTTRPVPRHAVQGGGAAGSSGVASWSAIGGRRLPSEDMGADGRFAPSPTGILHVGNLRTALLAWLAARSRSSRFLVRVEDLDTGRVRRRFEAEQLADLAALGLDWDGPVVRQSERGARYDDGAAPPRGRRAALPVLVHAARDPRGRLGAARRRCRRAPTPAPAAP